MNSTKQCPTTGEQASNILSTQSNEADPQVCNPNDGHPFSRQSQQQQQPASQLLLLSLRLFQFVAGAYVKLRCGAMVGGVGIAHALRAQLASDCTSEMGEPTSASNQKWT